MYRIFEKILSFSCTKDIHCFLQLRPPLPDCQNGKLGTAAYSLLTTVRMPQKLKSSKPVTGSLPKIMNYRCLKGAAL